MKNSFPLRHVREFDLPPPVSPSWQALMGWFLLHHPSTPHTRPYTFHTPHSLLLTSHLLLIPSSSPVTFSTHWLLCIPIFPGAIFQHASHPTAFSSWYPPSVSSSNLYLIILGFLILPSSFFSLVCTVLVIPSLVSSVFYSFILSFLNYPSMNPYHSVFTYHTWLCTHHL